MFLLVKSTGEKTPTKLKIGDLIQFEHCHRLLQMFRPGIAETHNSGSILIGVINDHDDKMILDMVTSDLDFFRLCQLMAAAAGFNVQPNDLKEESTYWECEITAPPSEPT